mgnify:CR=1 FL=1
MQTTAIKIKGSKFIGYKFEMTNLECFIANLELIKKEHPKATHIVYAYKFGNTSKFFDAKEPKHTAGFPILSLIEKKKLSNVCVIVVRYFGGTKLGASNLLRTYMNVAKELLK